MQNGESCCNICVVSLQNRHFEGGAPMLPLSALHSRHHILIIITTIIFVVGTMMIIVVILAPIPCKPYVVLSCIDTAVVILSDCHWAEHWFSIV